MKTLPVCSDCNQSCQTNQGEIVNHRFICVDCIVAHFAEDEEPAAAPDAAQAAADYAEYSAYSHAL